MLFCRENEVLSYTGCYLVVGSPAHVNACAGGNVSDAGPIECRQLVASNFSVFALQGSGLPRRCRNRIKGTRDASHAPHEPGTSGRVTSRFSHCAALPYPTAGHNET